MIDLIKGITDSYKERLKNPLLSSFLFSWLIVNWKVVLVIVFSEISVLDRIRVVDSEYSEMKYLLWLPICASMFYVILLPYLMWGLDKVTFLSWKGRKEFHHSQQIQVYEWKTQIAEKESELQLVKAGNRDKELLNLELMKLQKQVEHYAELIKDKDKEIENLENREKTVNQHQIDVSGGFDNLLEKLDSNTKKIYNEEFKKFQSNELYESFSTIGNFIRKGEALLPAYSPVTLDQYVAFGIITPNHSKNSPPGYYIFTAKGFYFWYRYLLSVNTKGASDADIYNNQKE